MKTIKILISVAGFALSTICFGQLLSSDNNEIINYTAFYNSYSSRLEHMLDIYPARSTAGDHFEAPLIKRTYFTAFEYDLEVEPWMTAPFETSVYEEPLQMESWMLSPFESGYYETELSIESWMTTPFNPGIDADEEIEIEPWMTAPWV
jgi:hypothetical protein